MWDGRQFGYNARVKRIFGILVVLCLLLTMATPAVAQSSGSEYFKETGHFVSGEFLTYYRSVSNATTLFGFPITEAFIKNGLTVQYFQRARFELYPSQPAGQRVRLTQIGRALYTPGEQLNIFNPFACRYFTQTGFSVCYAFLDFFKDNGGVERFGQPISSFEYHNDLIVQYFENARFEWKPWMPDGQRVSIADLGRSFFDKEKEDVNLLKPIDPGNRSGTTVQLQVRAFVWKAVTLASDQQLVYIIVQDQNLQPVSGAQGTATIRWADGTSGALTFTTNSSGVGIVPLTFINQPYGKMVNIEIFVTKDGLNATTTTSFRIWY
jgi:hypothetical protein